MSKSLLALFVALVLGAIVACKTPQPSPAATADGMKYLDEYLQEFQYERIVPARRGDGAGTIVRIVAGRERIVRSPRECLIGDSRDKVEHIDIALPKAVFSADQAALLEGSVPRELVGVDLKGVWSIGKVAKIELAFADPFKERVTEGTIMDTIRKLEKQDPCRIDATRPGNIVLFDVVGSKGMTFSFIDQSGHNLNVDAEIADAIGLQGGLRNTALGGMNLTVKGEYLLGYRAWEVTDQISGAVTSSLVAIPLEPLDIKYMKETQVEPR